MIQAHRPNRGRLGLVDEERGAVPRTKVLTFLPPKNSKKNRPLAKSSISVVPRCEKKLVPALEVFIFLRMHRN